MKIKLANNNVTDFRLLVSGDVFEHQGEYYMKIDECESIKAVNLDSGAPAYFTNYEMVTPVDGTFYIEG